LGISVNKDQSLKRSLFSRSDSRGDFQPILGEEPALKTDASATVERLLSDIRDLRPEIEARAAEIEGGRRVPRDLLETLQSRGLFRMFVPRSHGGLELDLPSVLTIIRAIARIDGSVGWTVMIGCGGTLLASLLPREFYDEIYRAGPDVIFAGSSQPTGTAEQAGCGRRVTGRWPFASGCEHADWIGGLCILTEDGKPLAGSEGTPLTRFFLLPARDWRIDDTWYVAGLKGTGSHHIAVNDAFVPQDNFADLVHGSSCVPGPLYSGPLQLVPLLHGAVAVGIAEGAVDDLVKMANAGRRQQRSAKAMKDSEIFRAELGRIEADLRAVRALHQVQGASHWQHALEGMLNDEALLTEGAQAAVWIAATCVRIADTCFALGGGAALYESSPLQRRMRDLHTAAQHAAVHPRFYVDAGALLLGDPQRSLTIGD
jgi:indole-3-acetate monooxygenase